MASALYEWPAMQDCSESELQVEQFALRFRDAELADKFAEATGRNGWKRESAGYCTDATQAFDDAKKQNATAAAAGQDSWQGASLALPVSPIAYSFKG